MLLMPADLVLLVNICGLSPLTWSHDACPLFWKKKVKTDHPLLKPSRWIKESRSANGAFNLHVHAVRPERESRPEQMSGDGIRVAQEGRAVRAPR